MNTNMSRKKDLCGLKFGRLTVIKDVGRTKSNSVKWLCKCECGNESIVIAANLIKGNTKSCGCYFLERVKRIRRKPNDTN